LTPLRKKHYSRVTGSGSGHPAGYIRSFSTCWYRIARQGIRPVEEIAATARRITSTNLRERIQAEGYPSELASLAGTFNEMLERLEDPLSESRDFQQT